MIPTTTAPYAAVLAVMMIGLSFYVTARRISADVSIYHGDDPDLAQRIRRHGNFIENVPMALILMAMGEALGQPAAWTHAAGLILIASRVLQPWGIRFDGKYAATRIVGGIGTWVAMTIPIVFILNRALVG